MPSFPRTISGFLLAFAVAAVGTIFYNLFWLKLVLTAAILFIYCTMYLPQLRKLWRIGCGILRSIAKK